MCVKFGDDLISSLDFSFIGVCTLKRRCVAFYVSSGIKMESVFG